MYGRVCLPGVVVEIAAGQKIRDYLRPGRLFITRNNYWLLSLDVRGTDGDRSTPWRITAVESVFHPLGAYSLVDIVVNDTIGNYIVMLGDGVMLFSEILTDLGFSDFLVKNL